jgi:CHAT domain
VAAADFELDLVWDDAQELFNVNLRFTTANNVDQSDHSTLKLDLDRLMALINDDEAYAAALTDMTFGTETIRNFYTLAIAAAQATPVHFRLEINGPARYHDVRWEMLRDPTNRTHPVATSRNVLFSRHLSGADWRPVLITPPHQPRALIMIANPTDLDGYAPGGRILPPVPVEAELANAQRALEEYFPVVLARPGAAASLDNLISRLNEGFDVVYLVAHGVLRKDSTPLIFLEKQDGTTDPVDAGRLVESVRGCDKRPSVVLLSSCQSAGTGTESQSDDGGALGPGLAKAGVAAVVAMQGNITMRTAGLFAPAFFEAFRVDGVVDRAVAIARDKIRDRRDWWVPVLFSRLRSGQVFFAAQFSDAGRAADTWDELRVMMTAHPPRLTPVVGPGLADGILGSRQEIALRWVRRWRMPIAEHGQGDLARVAQYLRVGRSTARVSLELEDYLRTELRERRRNARGEDPFRDLPGDLSEDRPEKVIEEVGRVLRERDRGDPYRVLAALPVKIFVTTGWTDLLQDALKARGKRPETRSFRWTDRIDWNEPRSNVRPPRQAVFARAD